MKNREKVQHLLLLCGFVCCADFSICHVKKRLAYQHNLSFLLLILAIHSPCVYFKYMFNVRIGVQLCEWYLSFMLFHS